jgi:hypothetical protein
MRKALLSYVLIQSAVPLLIAGHNEFRERLEGRVREYTVSERSRLWALLRVAKDFDVPLGIEWVHRSGPEQPVSCTWQDRSVLEIVTDLASVEGYGVEIQEGILQIFSDRIRAAKWNFLNLILDRFSAKNEMLGMAQGRLYNLLRHTIKQPKPVAPWGGIAGSIGIGAGGNRLVTVDLENATLREILCRLVVSAGGHSWVVIFPENPEVMQGGFARGLELYSLNSPPDGRQPVFALVPWEFQPPSRSSAQAK